MSKRNQIRTNDDVWGDPEPLVLQDPRHPTQPLDLDAAIPKGLAWLADYVRHQAEVLQVDEAMVAPLVLSVASCALTQSVELVGRPGHREPPVLWTATLAGPGERKSAVLETVLRPLRDAVTKRLSALPDEAPKPPLVVEDATPESVGSLAIANGGRLGIFSAEGDCLQMALGHYGKAKQGIYLSGYSGEPYTRSRISTGTESHDSVQIAIGLLVQQSVAENLLRNRQACNVGLVQRFLFVRPETGISPRRGYLDTPAIDAELVQRWADRIYALEGMARTGVDDPPRRVTLDDRARATYAAYCDEVACRQRSEGISELHREFLAKLHGNCLRIAGILALIENEQSLDITRDQVSAAIVWCRYFEDQLLGLLADTMVVNPDIADAKRVLDLVRARGKAEISASDIQQALRTKRHRPLADDWTPVFDLLVDRGYIRRTTKRPEGGMGGRPSATLLVNPKVLATNPENPGFNLGTLF